MPTRSILTFILTIKLLSSLFCMLQANTKIVLIAGKDSHGAGAHDWGDGVDLLHNALIKESGLAVEVAVHKGGWPEIHLFSRMRPP